MKPEVSIHNNRDDDGGSGDDDNEGDDEEEEERRGGLGAGGCCGFTSLGKVSYHFSSSTAYNQYDFLYHHNTDSSQPV